MHSRQHTALEFTVELTATGVLEVAGYSLTFQLLQALAVQNCWENWTQSEHGGALLDRFSSGARKIYWKFTSRALHGNLKNLLSGLHVARSNGPSSLYTGVDGSEKITAASVSKTPAPLFYGYNGGSSK